MTAKRHILRFLAVMAMIATVTFAWSSLPAAAVPAADPDNTVLILDTTVSGSPSLEETIALSLGFTVEVVNAATWAAMSQADFESYRAIILGDPFCSTSTASVAAAEANGATWGPAVDGNVVIIGTDPVLHQSLSGAQQLIESGIAFAADESGKTGAYITLSCYYAFAGPGTAVPLLDNAFGPSFTVVGQFEFSSCPAESHIIASHPALAGLTSADLSNWGCSTHEAFESWPASFIPLAINVDIGATEPYCETSIEGEDVCGGVYILARGEGLTPGGGDKVKVTKHWSHTNVCFERDNDGDGVASEDPVDYVDNDLDGSVDEDGSECPAGASLGDPLATDEDGNFQIKAVVTRSGKVSSYNPGQAYAVSTVEVTADVAGLVITENYSDCTTGEPPLLTLNPKAGGGGGSVVVVVLDELGNPVQVLDATDDEVAETDTEAVVTLGPQDAGTTIMVYVKFAPGQKGSTFAADSCENINSAQAVDEAGEPVGNEVSDTAVLELTAKS